VFQISEKAGKIKVEVVRCGAIQAVQLKSLLTQCGFRGNVASHSGEIECLSELIKKCKESEHPFDLTLARPFIEGEVAKLRAASLSAVKEILALEKRASEEQGRPFKLFPFQLNNVLKMRESRSILNCDAPGLGKTCQVLFTLPAKARVLVLCPKSAIGVWQAAIKHLRSDLIGIALKGTQSLRQPQEGEVLLLSYDSVPPTRSEASKGMDLDSFYRKLQPTYLVGDEIHYCKNYGVARTKRFRQLAGRVLKAGGRAIGLTGTPLVNKPVDLWCILQNLGLAKETFGSWDNYCQLMNGWKGKFGGYEWGTARSPIVNELLAKVVIRETLEEVFPEMPSKLREEVFVDLEDAVMEADLSVIWEELAHLSHDAFMERLADPSFTSMQQIREKLALLKVASCVELLKEIEEPVIVASWFKKPIEKLGKRTGWKCITGDTPQEERTLIQEEFTSGLLKGLAVTIGSSSVALNLQTCNRMIFLDRAYTVAANQQTEGRIYRIGQTRPCYYTYLLIDHPLEERINDILNEKQAMIDSTIEEIKVAPNRTIRKTQILEEILS
jgi:SNF2 family DNA or RNA helicase